MSGPGDEAPRNTQDTAGLIPTAFSRRVLRVFAIGAVAAVVLALVTQAGTVLLLLFAGALFAIFLNGCSAWLTRWLRFPYWLSLLLFILAVLGLTAGLAVWLGPRVEQEVASILEQVPSSISDMIGAARLRALSRQLTSGGGQGILRHLQDIVATATSAVRISVKVLSGLVIFFFLGVYAAAQPAVYRQAIVRLVPVRKRARAEEVISAIVAALRRWLFGRLVAMLVVGVGTTLGFFLLGLPVALALGLLAGLLTFIEYIGAIVSAAPALLLASEQGWTTVLWVLALFAAAHAVEGYVLTPFLARRTVRFPPAFTLSVQLLFGLFFGLMGLMLATPVSVVFTRLIQMLYVEDVLKDPAVATS